MKHPLRDSCFVLENFFHLAVQRDSHPRALEHVVVKTLSVIVCTHNPRYDYLQRCVDALQGQTLCPTGGNCSLLTTESDEPITLDLIWPPTARIVREETLGLSGTDRVFLPRNVAQTASPSHRESINQKVMIGELAGLNLKKCFVIHFSVWKAWRLRPLGNARVRPVSSIGRASRK